MSLHTHRMRANPANVLCIYHGNCADGFGAACVVRHALGPQVTFHAGHYGAPPPDVTGKHVILVDFSYPRDVLRRVRQVMAPDGYLFLGAAETTMGVDDVWERNLIGRSSVYRPGPS